MLVLLLRMGVGLWAALCETLPAVIGDYPVDVRLAGDADEVASFNNVEAVDFSNYAELMKRGDAMVADGLDSVGAESSVAGGGREVVDF